jgi:hypothetical protein
LALLLYADWLALLLYASEAPVKILKRRKVILNKFLWISSPFHGKWKDCILN